MQGRTVSALLDAVLSDKTIVAAIVAVVLAALEALRRWFVSRSADAAVIEADARHPTRPMHAEMLARALLGKQPQLLRPFTSDGHDKAIGKATARAAKRAGKVG